MKILILNLGNYKNMKEYIEDFNFKLINNYVGNKEEIDLPNIEVKTSILSEFNINVVDPTNELELSSLVTSSLVKPLTEQEFENLFYVLATEVPPRFKSAEDVLGLYDANTKICIEVPNKFIVPEVTTETDEQNSYTIFTNYIYKSQTIPNGFDVIIVIDNPDKNTSNNYDQIENLLANSDVYTIVYTSKSESEINQIEYDKDNVEFVQF